MGISRWLEDFRALHGRALRGELQGVPLAEYRTEREALVRFLLSAQRVNLLPGQTPRRALRVTRPLQVDIRLTEKEASAMTLDVSTYGFAALLAKRVGTNEMARVTLWLPGGDPIESDARVVAITPQTIASRVAFGFCGLAEPEIARLEEFVFNAVVEQLKVD